MADTLITYEYPTVLYDSADIEYDGGGTDGDGGSVDWDRWGYGQTFDVGTDVTTQDTEVNSFKAVGTITDQAAASSAVLAMPSGVVPGDLLIMVVAFNVAFNVPTGWSDVGVEDGFFLLSTNALNWLYRVADGTEGASVTLTAAAARLYGGFIVAYTTTSTTPVGKVVSVSGTSSPSFLTVTSGTEADPNSYNETLLYMWGGQGQGNVTSSTTDAATTARVQHTMANGPLNQIHIGFSDELFVAAANYPARTFTITWASNGAWGGGEARQSSIAAQSGQADTWFQD